MAFYSYKPTTRTLRFPISVFKSINGISTGMLDMDLELHAGENIITVQAVDSSGNISEESEPLIVVLDIDTVLNNYIRRDIDDRFSTSTIRRQYKDGQLSSYTINSTVDELRVELQRYESFLNMLMLRIDQTIKEHPAMGNISESHAGLVEYDLDNIDDDMWLSPGRQLDSLFDQYANLSIADWQIDTFEFGATSSNYPVSQGQSWTLGYYIGKTEDDSNNHLFMRPTGDLLLEMPVDIQKAVLILYCKQELIEYLEGATSITVDAVNVPFITDIDDIDGDGDTTDIVPVYWGTIGSLWDGSNFVPLTWAIEQYMEQNNVGKITDTPVTLPIVDPVIGLREEDFEYNIYDNCLTRIELDITKAMRFLIAGYKVIAEEQGESVRVGLNGLRLRADDRAALQVFTSGAIPHILIYK